MKGGAIGIVIVACVLAGTASPDALGRWPAIQKEALVADTMRAEDSPRVCATADGGYYIAWVERTATVANVHLQRCDSLGNEQWAHNGVALANPNMVVALRLAADGEGNALLAFEDNRFGGDPHRITVMKVAPTGAPMWGASGVQLGDVDGYAWLVDVAATPGGSVAVLMSHYPAGAPSGVDEVRWLAADGTPVGDPYALAAPENGYTMPADLLATSDEAAVVTWIAYGAPEGALLLAQKLTADGMPGWGIDAILHTAAGGNFVGDPAVATAADPGGGVIFGWSTIEQCYVQHLLADGTPVFMDEGLPATRNMTRTRGSASVSYDGQTKAIYLFWDEVDFTPTYDEVHALYAQMFDQFGAPQWGDDGTAVVPFGSATFAALRAVPFKLEHPIPIGPQPIVIYETAQGGFTQQNTIRAAAVNMEGRLAWPFGTAYICARTDAKMQLDVARTPTHAIVTVWTDERNSRNDIYQQRLYVNGSRPTPNLPVADGPEMQHNPFLCPTADGGCYVAWCGDVDQGCDVYLQRLDAAGNELWPHGGILVADRDFTWTQTFGLGVDADGNAVLAFRDSRFGDWPVATVQKVSPEGLMLWGPTGVQAGGTVGEVSGVRLAVAGDQHVVVGWQEDDGTEMFHLRFQRFDAAGTPTWAPAGLPIMPPANSLFFMANMAPADGGNVIVAFNRAWWNGPMNMDQHLWAQKLGPDGAPLWGPTPLPVCDDPGHEIPMAYHVTLLPDGAGGAVMTWFTAPPWGETSQVRVQHVLSDGTERFAHNGLCVSGDPGLHHMLPAAVYDQATSEIVVFFVDEMPREPLPSLYALRAQRVGAIGVLLWGADGRLLTDWRETQLIYTRAVRSGDHFVAMWDELGDVDFSATLLAAALDGSGQFVWPRKITPLAAILNGEQKLHPQLVAAPDGGLLVAWSESRVDWGDIMAQRVNPDGTLGLPWSWADFTGDGAVNYTDYELFLRAFGATLDAGHYCAEADYDADGLVSLVDYQRWLAAYRLYVGNPAARPPTPPTRAMSPTARPDHVQTARPMSNPAAPATSGAVFGPQR